MRRLALSALLLCAACTTAPTPTPSSTGTTTTTTTVTTTTASPGELAPRRVKAATLPADALADLGAEEVTKEGPWTRWGMPTACRAASVDDSDEFGYYVYHGRHWEGPDFGLHHGVAWFKEHGGADVVAKIRAHAESCERYVAPEYSGSDQPITVTAFDVPPVPGTDAAYGYCEANDAMSACWVVLSGGDLVSITVIGGIPHQDESVGIVLDLLPAVAERLAG